MNSPHGVPALLVEEIWGARQEAEMRLCAIAEAKQVPATMARKPRTRVGRQETRQRGDARKELPRINIVAEVSLDTIGDVPGQGTKVLSDLGEDGAQTYAAWSWVLELSDGHAWNLQAGEGSRLWLQEFARILTIPSGVLHESPRLIFVRGTSGSDWFGPPAENPDTHALSIIMSQGWRPTNLILVRMWSPPTGEDRICELLNTDDRSIGWLMMGQSLHPIFDTVMARGGIPLHAALVKLEQKGVLLVGTGSSGKSTCCRRIPAPWSVLCDDETLVLRCTDGRYYAHPLPTWNDLILRKLDHTWDVHSRVELRAIVYIRQSDFDGIQVMGRGEAATRICRSSEEICLRHTQCFPDLEIRSWRKRAFDNACRIGATVPVFVLHVSRFGFFWQHLERVLDDLSG